MGSMRRMPALLLALAFAASGCSPQPYESADFEAGGPGDSVILWRLIHGPTGFVGIGGPLRASDLEEDAGPLTLWPYRSEDGRSWQRGERLGELADPVLGLAAGEDLLAASGLWDGRPAVLVSDDGLTWRRTELTGEVSGFEVSGIAVHRGIVLVSGFDATEAPLVWRVGPDGEASLLDASALGIGGRLPHIVSGPAGFVAAQEDGGALPGAAPVWVSPDGISWDPVLNPFGDGVGVGGLVGSGSGYVAVAASLSDDRSYTLWVSPDGVEWEARADQQSVFRRLIGTGGDLYPDLSGEPAIEPSSRPIAFSSNGRWLEMVEAHHGRRFVTVAVAATGEARILSGFTQGRPPVPLILVAGG